MRKKPSSSEKTVQAKVRGGSREGRSETMGVGFVKEVGFKAGMKERGSYRCTEWWIRRGRSDGWRNRWVGNWRTGTRIRLTKRKRDMIPETRWSITEVERKSSCSAVFLSLLLVILRFIIGDNSYENYPKRCRHSKNEQYCIPGDFCKCVHSKVTFYV